MRKGRRWLYGWRAFVSLLSMLASFTALALLPFAQATGRDPERLDDGRELRSFEEFLLACLRLVMPLATFEEIQAIRRGPSAP